MLIAPRKVANGFPTLRRTRSKLVQRRSDASDRRKVLVEATDKTRELIRGTYVPIAQAGVKMLASYSVAELTAIGRFVEDALVLQQRMTTKLLERKQKN
jgi:DNA-binding MarR family transcriptional regulator